MNTPTIDELSLYNRLKQMNEIIRLREMLRANAGPDQKQHFVQFGVG